MAEDLCGEWAKVAEQIMQLRQDNAPMDEVYQAVDGDLAKKLVIAAYDEPLWGTERYKLEAIGKFRSEVFKICISSKQES